jgi:hypothetical protein
VHVGRIFLLGLVAVFAVVANGTTASGGAPSRAVDCDSRTQVLPSGPLHLHTHQNIGLGPVVLSAWFRNRPRSEFRPEPGHDTRLIKAPLFVKAGPPVTISLLDSSANHAEIDVATDRGPSVHGTSVEFTPCPPDATVGGRRVGRVTPFIGGYRVDGPFCMRIAVRVAGDDIMAVGELPFGRGSCR